MRFVLTILTMALAVAPLGGTADDVRVHKASGFKNIELLCDVEAIAPGEPFKVGMLFTLLPEYHTYWRGPGIVGVAPTFEWKLPQGFTVGKTYWPPPEEVDMAGIKANGFHGELLLITELTPPDGLEEKPVSLELRAAWMACATSCHPGLADFAMTLPVLAQGSTAMPNEPVAERFNATLNTIPKAAPPEWKWSTSRSKDTITLKLELPEGSSLKSGSQIHFFCDDMQVDSDQDQKTRLPENEPATVIQELPVPDFAPENPARLSGLLFNTAGWPGTDSQYVEVSIPWVENSSDHE